MKVGTILLTPSNKYVDSYGGLPERPAHDKELLKGMVHGQSVTPNGYIMLPPSIKSVASEFMVHPDDAFPVTIRELNGAELLIISRSPSDFDGGKEFRLDNFRCLVKDVKVEIWVRDVK